MTLLDDLTAPTVRQAIGNLMAASSLADLAVAHVRLAAIDLTTQETARLQRLRLLLSRFDATFAADAHALITGPQTEQLRGLLHIVESGRVEIRSTGVAMWTPDFSIYRGLPAGREDVLMIGAHYFRPLFSSGGTALTCVVRDASAVSRADRRFQELWEQAYDVRGVIAETLSVALACTGAG